MKKYILLLTAILPSGIRKVILRLLGASIGENTQLGWGSLILFQDDFTLGDHVKIAPFCVINCKSGYIGSFSEITPATLITVPRFRIGRDCKISYGTIIRSGHTTKRSELVIGDLVHVFPFVMIDCSRKVTIGDGTGIGPKCNVFTHSSYKSILEGYSVAYADVEIGERVELTYNVFVAPGVKIGDDAICAYGAYVNKDVEAGVLVAGMPAVVKRTREQFVIQPDERETIKILSEILDDYRENISIVNGREPLGVHVLINGQNELVKVGHAYILINSTVDKAGNKKHAVFDVNRGLAINKGLSMKDFNGLRKYLSRYGIRFISEDTE